MILLFISPQDKFLFSLFYDITAFLWFLTEEMVSMRTEMDDLHAKVEAMRNSMSVLAGNGSTSPLRPSPFNLPAGSKEDLLQINSMVEDDPELRAVLVFTFISLLSCRVFNAFY